ncbi:MAG TPA: VOC family protein [Mesorhizobium sp.]|jgi:catechol 2,3-dioxygenase-like lactoylglutathione lyase family enzyme|uniref:VOC family protein n=1 Tax=Mesorhizobium sp. TaxID=1871066 RepID=UPI002DDD239A|nr:VOC family protein [Mesorhizobium sp.]HEV2505193.1 VOC family protein [Mesorhizobium sp.]
MLHHVEIYVSDLEASHAFWANILVRIGYEETGHWDGGFTLGREEDTYLTFVQVAKKYREHRYHRCGVGLNHLAFKVKGREAVDALRQYCIDHDIHCLYDEKYPFANGGKDYYALFVEDPDRIKVEFVAEG